MVRVFIYTFLFSWLLPQLALAAPGTLAEWISEYCPPCTEKLTRQSGAYILERGEEALMARAWLAEHSLETIDVQYFIWSTDNIGILAGESLLKAAERGVKVRVLVDDLLIDAEDDTLLALDAHPNVQIRIYNPKHAVGVSTLERIINLLTDFRAANQRMHDKTAIFDNLIGITGGRNMADEYFDYNQEYTFRDRDVLLMGRVVNAMTVNFNEFWHSRHARPVKELLKESAAGYTAEKAARHYAMLHSYAGDPDNYEPEVRRAISSLHEGFSELTKDVIWSDIRFISDAPGKNPGRAGLSGGGRITSELIELIETAEESILIQSPYLVMEDEWIEFFKRIVAGGVRIRIVTNSLLSTDNLMAYSGYHKRRDEILEAGVELYEYKPDPAIRSELMKRYSDGSDDPPIFALHAKSMVIDGERSYIGTFNFDPRSANLNTEVGVLIDNARLSGQLAESIERDMQTGNSWRITADFNPDDKNPWLKRLKLFCLELLPLTPVL